MAKRRISQGDGMAALQAVLGGNSERLQIATAVRFLLEELAERAPGNSLEVRVPPFGATQCVAGPRHTRGTPPNVVECDPATWIELATGSLSWEEALASARISASGTRANLEGLVPLVRPSWAR
ncbi:sterol carrier family protein [Leucobacter sp. UT-8R-CII-1-4]|uniref:sterol carrier family protein n=1 Tax=Leucobacter sp. UT-8R-CII-1-4 TaxID=3040075 RepID=UPI0024A8695F|nr:sterol carrier family protein [Leucobacter sp. UT-8R-CII-1-4]MDI6022487.1 sterol carrier family protein [Leucobacter sp. UT-8R-CII-1-4]